MRHLLLLLLVLVPQCGTLDRITVRLLQGGPYTFVSCPSPLTVTRTVKLHGRLGRRAIRDGSTKPPRTRYRAP